MCDTFDLSSWACAGIAFAVSYTVRVLAMMRGWEEPLAKSPPGTKPPDEVRPRLGPKLMGRSEPELRDLGLLPEDGPDQDET